MQACPGTTRCSTRSISRGHATVTPAVASRLHRGNVQPALSLLARPNQHGQRYRCRAVPDQQEEDPITPFTPIQPNFMYFENKHNRMPDFRDEDWMEKVDDWSEFWNEDKWQNEAITLEDYVDTAGNPIIDHAVGPDGLIIEMDYIKTKIKRMHEVATRGDIINMTPAPLSQKDHSDVWEDPPMEPEGQAENPPWDLNDVRALAEKLRVKQLMDMEWHRRQSKIGKLKRREHGDDPRLREFQMLDYREDWTEEEIRDLITMNGTALLPEDHRAFIENPLMVADMPNTHGVHHIVETEDFLEQIGHLGRPDYLQSVDLQGYVNILEDETLTDEDKQEMLEALYGPQLAEAQAAVNYERRRKAPNTWTGDQVVMQQVLPRRRAY